MEDFQNSAVESDGTRPTAFFSLKRFRSSLHFAWQGLRWAWSNQQNLRLEACLLLLAVTLAAWLGVSSGLILLSWLLVIAFELLNTAVELTVDLASPGWNELAGRAKDLSAAAVLIVALGVVLVNALILLPPLLARLGIL